MQFTEPHTAITPIPTAATYLTASAGLHLAATTPAPTLHLTVSAPAHRTAITDRPATIGGLNPPHSFWSFALHRACGAAAARVQGNKAEKFWRGRNNRRLGIRPTIRCLKINSIGAPCDSAWGRSPGPHGTCLRVDSVVVKSASAVVRMSPNAYPRRCCGIRRASQQ